MNVDFLTNAECNIFCKLNNRREVLEFLERNMFKGSRLTHQNIDEKLVVKIENVGANIVFFVRKRTEGGDGVSKLLRGAKNYFRKVNTEETGNKQFILETLDYCDSTIGIRMEPGLAEKFGYPSYIQSLVKEFGGLIFNGCGALDGDGELILDDEGFFTTVYEQK